MTDPTSGGVRRVSYDEVLHRAIRGKLARSLGAPLEIGCYDVRSVAFRDLVDLLTPLYGYRSRTWVDRYERRHPAASWGRACRRIAAEIFWHGPAAYVRNARRVRGLFAQPRLRSGPTSLDRALFIRSDHWFGVAAGGSVGHITGVVNGLRGLGVHVDVLTNDHLAGLPEDERFHMVPPVYSPVRNLPELPRLTYNEQLLATAAAHWAEWNPGFVYHRYSMHSYVGPALRQRFRVPYVCEYNGSFVWMNRNWGKRPMYFEKLGERIEMLNLLAADLVVVVSEAMAEEVEERGIARDKVLVNPNGVDPAQYHPGISAQGIRERHGLQGKLVVGFIGTFGPWHGAEQLPRAAAHLKERGLVGAGCPLHFLLIGNGDRMAEVRQIIEEHGLHDSFTLTGRVPQEDGPAHLAACDVLASPHVPNPDGTPFFGSPTKLFEYMAMGRAIVASDLDQIGEVLSHGDTAWLVPPGDSDALADGIEALARDPELRSALGARAREEACASYTWDAHTRRILSALRERLATSAPTPTP